MNDPHAAAHAAPGLPTTQEASSYGRRLHLVATCPEETKAALALELQALGVQDLRPAFRAIEMTVEPAQYYELHLRLRTASRSPSPVSGRNAPTGVTRPRGRG